MQFVKPINGFTLHSEVVKLCDNKIPALFIDECSVGFGERGDDFTNKFKFIRRLLRFSGFLTFFMGTNAAFVNFVGKSKNTTDSRTDGKTPWCYIVYHLVSYSETILNKEIDELKNQLLDDINGTKKYFLIQIKKLMTKERPLFCKFILQFLNGDDEFKGNIEFEPLKWLIKIIEYVNKEFCKRKNIFQISPNNDTNNFNISNLSMMSEIICDQFSNFIDKISNTPTDEKEQRKIDNKLVYIPCSSIHKHIGYLKTNQFVERFFPTFFQIGLKVGYEHFTVVGASRQYKEDNEKYDDSFQLLQKFETFSNELFSLMPFSGIVEFDSVR